MLSAGRHVTRTRARHSSIKAQLSCQVESMSQGSRAQNLKGKAVQEHGRQVIWVKMQEAHAPQLDDAANQARPPKGVRKDSDDLQAGLTGSILLDLM